MCPPNTKPLLDLSNFGDEVLEVVVKVKRTEEVIYNFLLNPDSPELIDSLKQIVHCQPQEDFK